MRLSSSYDSPPSTMNCSKLISCPGSVTRKSSRQSPAIIRSSKVVLPSISIGFLQGPEAAQACGVEVCLSSASVPGKNTLFCDILLMTRRCWPFLLLLVPLLSFGQSSELGGTVRDPNGSGVPNARIELRNQDTGVQLQAKTNRNGEFRVASVRVGLYQATVQAAGFRTLTRDDIRVAPQYRVQLDLVLQPSTPAR